MYGCFITGTDTGIGKTRVSAGLLKAFTKLGRRTVGMKPVASGAAATPEGLRNDDALLLQSAASEKRAYRLVNPYCFAPAIAPHLAAMDAGVEVSMDTLRAAYAELWRGADTVVVEGVGGWQVPLSPLLELPDLARELELPVILVVGLRLGCLNHAALTARALAADGFALAGWVANAIDPAFERPEANLATLEAELRAPLLGRLAYAPKADVAAVAEELVAACRQLLGR
ncbi:MAG TPA: dethiobiotin synthase [Gammaproteobacteria bacterium]|nr:dethiobiotin synthase [Gammaproteobacteria bacterium]